MSKLAAVEALLSLLRRATGPVLGSRLLGVPDEVVRPRRLRARLPEDNLRVRPFCRGKDDGKAVGTEEDSRGSGSVRASTAARDVCCVAWNGDGEPENDHAGLFVIEDAL